MKRRRLYTRLRASIVLMALALHPGCAVEEMNCLEVPGTLVEKEVVVPPFHQVVVYGKVKLFIEQGDQQKVSLRAGQDLMDEISLEVEGGKLAIRDESSCDFLRTTYVPEVHLTVPELDFIENAGNKTIESVGPLVFPKLRLRSNNLDKNPEVYTNGDFDLEIQTDTLFVSGDDFSNFFLSGSTDYLHVSFWAGDGRLEAADVVAEEIQVFHRGTNKMIVNPQQSLRGQIRSTGDVLSVNRPPIVEVTSYYTGRLYFE